MVDREMIDSSEKKTILLLDTDGVAAAQLKTALEVADINAEITLHSAVSDVISQLQGGKINLCFLGRGLGLGVQRKFITSFFQLSPLPPCALIAVSDLPDKEVLLDYVKLGVHGVLLLPCNTSTLRQVIVTALHALKSQLAGGPSLQEQVTSLPWILETIARRLDGLATELREKQRLGASLPVTAKSIRESILKAFALAEKDENIPNELIRLFTSKLDS